MMIQPLLPAGKASKVETGTGVGILFSLNVGIKWHRTWAERRDHREWRNRPTPCFAFREKSCGSHGVSAREREHSPKSAAALSLSKPQKLPL